MVCFGKVMLRTELYNQVLEMYRNLGFRPVTEEDVFIKVAVWAQSLIRIGRGYVKPAMSHFFCGCRPSFESVNNRYKRKQVGGGEVNDKGDTH